MLYYVVCNVDILADTDSSLIFVDVYPGKPKLSRSVRRFFSLVLGIE